MSALIGCDGVGEKYVPVADPENMYFYPLSVGETASFRYSHIERNYFLGVNFASSGRLDWTVVDSTAEDGIPVITIEEKLRGYSLSEELDGSISRDTIIVDATRYATFLEDRLVFPPYTDYVDSWHWSYAKSTLDTVWLDVYMGGTLDYTRSKKVTLVRELGLYRWYSGTSGVFEDWDLLERILP